MSFEAPQALTCIEYRMRIEKGTRRPFLVGAQAGDGKPQPFVIKLRDRPEISGPQEIANELLCAILARNAGLPVPDFAILEVTEEFLEIVPREHRGLFKDSLGANFGTAFVAGAMDWEPGNLRPSLYAVAEQILSFDSVAYNTDRARPDNLLFTGDSLLMIDHERCLNAAGFNPVRLEERPIPSARNNVCFRALPRDHEVTWLPGGFPLDDELLAAVVNEIPEGWWNSLTPAEVLNFLQTRRDSLVEIAHMIQSALCS